MGVVPSYYTAWAGAALEHFSGWAVWRDVDCSGP
jgi:hypothetical protein